MSEQSAPKEVPKEKVLEQRASDEKVSDDALEEKAPEVTEKAAKATMQEEETLYLPAALAHLLTLPYIPSKPREGMGLLVLRARVYDVLARIPRSWPQPFLELLQTCVLRELDEARGGSTSEYLFVDTYVCDVQKTVFC